MTDVKVAAPQRGRLLRKARRVIDWTLLAGVFVSLILSIVFVSNSQLLAAAVSVTVGSVFDGYLGVRHSAVLRLPRTLKLGSMIRSLMRMVVLLIAFSHTTVGHAGGVFATVLLGFGLLHVARMGNHASHNLMKKKATARVGWLNFPVGRKDFVPHPALASSETRIMASEMLLAASAVVGLLWADARFTFALVGAAVVLNAFLVIKTVFNALAYTKRESFDVQVDSIQENINTVAAKVVLHHTTEGGSAAVNTFVRAFSHLVGTPHMTVMREFSQFSAMEGQDSPTLLVPRASDAEVLHFNDAETFLYFSQSPKNNHFLRFGRMMHCFVDLETGPVLPSVRMFDEIWVMSQARKNAYLSLTENMDADKIIVVGSLPKVLASIDSDINLREDLVHAINADLTYAEIRSIRMQNRRHDDAKNCEVPV